MDFSARLAVAGACSGGTKTPTPPKPPLPGNEAKLELPAIPAKIGGHDERRRWELADQKSPVIDILKAENEREIEALRRRPEPAYYLAYQLVEQRIVNLEAEGGALIQDNDDTARNLDVEVRVGIAEARQHAPALRREQRRSTRR